MDMDKIIERLKKLQALATNNPSVEEAARAAEMVQRLKEQYDLHDACLAVERDEPEEFNEIVNEVVRPSRRVPTWEAVLVNVLAECNGCKCYVHRGLGIRVVGCPEDVETVRWFHSYLADEINRLCATIRASIGATGRTWGNSFRLGAVDTLSQRLRKAKAEARQDARQSVAHSETALAIVDKGLARLDAKLAAVTRWTEDNLRLRSGGKRRSRRDADAFGLGKWAGQGIGLGGRHALQG